MLIASRHIVYLSLSDDVNEDDEACSPAVYVYTCPRPMANSLSTRVYNPITIAHKLTSQKVVSAPDLRSSSGSFDVYTEEHAHCALRPLRCFHDGPSRVIL